MPLLPLFIWTLTAAPPVRPWSASRLPVETLTSWIASSPGTYAETCGSHTLVAVAPSIRMLFEFREVPLALKEGRAPPDAFFYLGPGPTNGMRHGPAPGFGLILTTSDR